MGDGTWGNRLGTLKIGVGRSQEALGWLPPVVCQEREDFGSYLEPDLRLSDVPFIFAQQAGDLPLPSSALGGSVQGKEAIQVPPHLLTLLRNPLSRTSFRTCTQV